MRIFVIIMMPDVPDGPDGVGHLLVAVRIAMRVHHGLPYLFIYLIIFFI